MRCPFDIENLRESINLYHKKTTEEGFWDDIETAQTILKQIKNLENDLHEYEKIEEEIDEVQILFELAHEDSEMEEELIGKLTSISDNIEKYSIKILLNGKYDNNNAILSLHSGTGGLDAQDWAEMLLRMYVRFCQQNDYKFSYLDLQKDEEAGIKSATIKIEGPYAYGYLKGEKGVHRLVRISPFDSSGKRHTSFASIDVLPEIDDDVNIEINPKDLKIDTYRASGAGGQHVNKTDSAIRITHIPTGIVVQCQNERSQHMNKEQAMKMLTSKLVEIKEQEHKEKIEDISGNYSQIAWGSQIRSYVFQPYTLVKDHRTNKEIGNISAVMDGEIMPFITSYLSENAKNESN